MTYLLTDAPSYEGFDTFSVLAYMWSAQGTCPSVGPVAIAPYIPVIERLLHASVDELILRCLVKEWRRARVEPMSLSPLVVNQVVTRLSAKVNCKPRTMRSPNPRNYPTKPRYWRWLVV